MGLFGVNWGVFRVAFVLAMRYCLENIRYGFWGLVPTWKYSTCQGLGEGEEVNQMELWVLAWVCLGFGLELCLDVWFGLGFGFGLVGSS
jgi:hypothetical protein